MMVISMSATALFLSLLLALVRLIKGPTLADRVVALDLISFITIGFIAYTPCTADKKPCWISLLH